MKVNWNNKYATIATYALIVIICSIVTYSLASNIDVVSLKFKGIVSTLQPFFIGASLAYILNFVLKFYENKLLSKEVFKKLSRKSKRGLGILLTYLTAAFVSYLFIQFVLPQLIDSILGLANDVPKYFNNLTIMFDDLVGKLNLQPEYVDLILTKFNEMIGYVLNIASNLVPVIGNYIMAILSSILNIFIGIIISIYILCDKEKFLALSKKIVNGMFSKEKCDIILRLGSISNDIFGKFLGGKIIDSFIVGVLTFIILTIFKMPYALLISVIVGVTNIIPFFGPFIGAIPSAIKILFDSQSKVILFIIIIFIIQQLDGNIIGPKILGDSIGMSAFWILFSLLVAAKVMGFIGMIIGVPLFAIIYSIIKEIIEDKLVKKGLPRDTEDYL